MRTKSASAHVEARSDSGSFDCILSNGSLDRDGEILSPDMWVQPLPESVSVNCNHSPDVADIVASGRPWFDAEGNLRVSGTFAQTDQAQHIRSLVRDGHLKSMSVEFLRRPDGRNELVGAAFVTLPSNRDCRVLASKAALADFRRELDRLFTPEVKSAGGGDCDDVENAARLLQLRVKLASR